MSTMQSKQCLQSTGLQLQTKREPTHREQRRPSTPGSPEDLAFFSLPSLNYASRFEPYTGQSLVNLESLQSRLADLPQELYDEILHFSLVCDAGNERFPSATKKGSPITQAQYISESYKPPVQLALNRSIRQDTLQRYYRDTTFIFSDHGVLKRWMRSLSKEAIDEIKEARVVEATASCVFTGIYTKPEHPAGKQDDSGDIWKTWNLKIETRQSCAGNSTRAQEFVSVARNWYKWH